MDLSNANTQMMVGSIIRCLLVTFGGGAVFSGDQISALAGALAVIVGLAWSLVQKSNSVSHATLASAVNRAAADPANTQNIIAAAKAGHF